MLKTKVKKASIANLLRKSADLISTLQTEATKRAKCDEVDDIASTMVSKGLIDDKEKHAKVKELQTAQDLEVYKKALEILPGEPDRLSTVTKKAHMGDDPLDSWIFG